MSIIFALLCIFIIVIFIIIVTCMCKRKRSIMSSFTDKQAKYATKNKSLFMGQDNYAKIKQQISMNPIDYYELKKWVKNK